MVQLDIVEFLKIHIRMIQPINRILLQINQKINSQTLRFIRITLRENNQQVGLDVDV
jgi:hypothetical protein